MDQAVTKKNPISWTIRYLREAREELAKVSWPSRKDTLRYSALVIGVTALLSAVFAGVDLALTYGLQKLIDLSS